MAKDLSVQLSLVSDKFQKGLNEASRSLKSVESSALSLNKTFSLLKGAAAGALGGVGVGMAVDLMKIGAAAKQAEQSFMSLAANAGKSGTAIVEAMKKATAGTIDDSDLMQKAIKGMALGLSGDEMAKIGEMARQTARVTGESVSATFEKLADSISTNMPKALKQMGLITKEQMKVVEAAFAAGVEQVDLFTIAYANFQDQQAKLGPVMDNEVERITRLEVRWKQFKETIGIGMIGVIMSLVHPMETLNAAIDKHGTYGVLPKALRGADINTADYVPGPGPNKAKEEIERLRKETEALGKKKKAVQDAAIEQKEFIREIERLSLEAQKTIEQGDTNQWKNMEHLIEVRETEEKKAAADRMKLYEKIGEDEEATWKYSTKIYKQELGYQEEFAKQAARNMQDSFADFFFDVISGKLNSFSDYWKSFWNSLKTTVANSLAEMALTWAKNNIFSGTGGTSILGQFIPGLLSIGSTVLTYAGDAVDWITSIIGHEGGLVGENGIGRGAAGLAPDEVAAILQKGEYVIPKDIMDAIMRGHGPGLAGEGVVGPEGTTMSAAQAIGLLGMALGLPAIGAAIFGGSLAGLAIAGLKGGKAAINIADIVLEGHFWDYMAAAVGLGPQGSSGNIGSGFAFGTGEYGGYEGAMGGQSGPSQGGEAGMAYATGGIVPYTQMARVHGGEGIFTPTQMQHLRTSDSTDELMYWLQAVADRPIKVFLNGNEIAKAVAKSFDQGEVSWGNA